MRVLRSGHRQWEKFPLQSPDFWDSEVPAPVIIRAPRRRQSGEFPMRVRLGVGAVSAQVQILCLGVGIVFGGKRFDAVVVVRLGRARGRSAVSRHRGQAVSGVPRGIGLPLARQPLLIFLRNRRTAAQAWRSGRLW